MKRLVPTLIVTSYFAIDPREIHGGIGERYVGLYGSLVKKFSRKYALYWFSCDDHLLREFDPESKVNKFVRASLPFAILSLVAKLLRSTRFKQPLVVLIAYPYAMHRHLESFLSLGLLGFLSLFRLAVIMVDDFDPPIEAYVTWNEHIPLRLLLALKLLDSVVIKLAKIVIFPSESYKNYFSKKYKSAVQKFRVIHNGSLIDLIDPKPPGTGALTMLYAGSLFRVKDVSCLIAAVENLRKQNLDVRLVLSGELGMSFEEKPWIDYHSTENNWLSWVKNVLEKADVCVLPYPPRIHWNLTHLAKVSDYMAAGKPVISTNLTETYRIFTKYKCGLIADDWNHFEELVKKLYRNRELAINIGKAARRTVEENFSYSKLAEELEKIIYTDAQPHLFLRSHANPNDI